MTLTELFTLADEKPLLTDPELTAEQKAKRARSCQAYFIVNTFFAALWVILAIAHVLRQPHDDAILFWATFLMATLSSTYFARKYYLMMRGYQA
jgi:hypothetical protein